MNESDCVNIELKCDKIINTASKEISIPPFQNLDINFSFLAYLPHLLEITKHTDINSTILRGNLIGPKIEISGLVMQNWGVH